MGTAGLHGFFNPRSVAIVGASPERTKIRGALLHLLQKNGYPGAIYPINPSYGEIDGLRCYASAAAIGEAVDLALVAIPAGSVLPALEECAAAGVRHAVIISSGFAEDDAAPADLQGKIAALAHASGMRICGPNAEGFYNEPARVTATFSPAVDGLPDMPVATARRVAVVAQSGGMGFALFNRGRALGLGFSSVVSTGNEADLTVADFLQHAADDADTGGVLMFVETIRDPAGFRAAAESAAAAGKPVVAIKIGRSAVGQLAAASHTAALAGWDAGYDAMFRRHGITVAADLDEALAVMGALMTNPRAEGNRVAILTVSGGAGALAADALSLAGLDVPELSEASQAAIRSFIPSYGSARNPVDLTAQGAHGGGMLRATALLLDDPAVDMVAIVTSLANPARVSLTAADLRELIARRRKPVLIYSYTLPSELGRKTVAEAGAVVLPSMTLLGAAARALAQQQPAARLPVAKLPPAASARLDSGPLSEHAVKALLAQCGVVIAPSRLVKEAAGLDAAAAELGFPLALKIQSPDIIHKTELGGVRLGIADRDALHAAYAAVLEAARHAPAARIEGVLLEPMAANGTEWIVGIVRDPVAGPVLTVGAGGTQAELLRDVARRVAPVDEAEAAAMLQELRSAPLLHGFRGRPPADVPALTRLIAQVSALAAASDRIMELELNPVIVHAAGQGCTIADALLALRPAGGS